MKLSTLKHRLTTVGVAYIDTITFSINKDVQKWIKKQEKAGYVISEPSDIGDNYLQVTVVEFDNSDVDL